MRFLARAKGSIEASFSEMGKTVRQTVWFCFGFGEEWEEAGEKEFNVGYVQVEMLNISECSCQAGNLIYESGIWETGPG